MKVKEKMPRKLRRTTKPAAAKKNSALKGYGVVLERVVELLEKVRRISARAVNSVMTTTYWEIGRRIVEHEQGGRHRAGYGERLLEQLSKDLSARFGRGFSVQNLLNFRSFYIQWPIPQTLSGELDASSTMNPTPILQTLSAESGAIHQAMPGQIRQTVSAKSVAVPTGTYLPIHQTPSDELTAPPTKRKGRIVQTVSAQSAAGDAQAASPIPQTLSGELSLRTGAQPTEMPRFPLPWSHYVRLLSVDNPQARRFYETEIIRAGWSVRQLDRQISSLFYERTALSRNKAAMLKKGAQSKPEDQVTPEEEIKDPLVLEFLGLKDEYSETELEEALIRHLQAFLLELGDDFTFVGRQRRLRIGDEWYRVDLLFFHRRLRCLIVIDLKLGKFSNADAGQMHTYLNYAREHWTRPGENPPVGLILCAQKNDALARYALDNLPNKVLAAEYRLALPDERLLAEEIERTRKEIEGRRRGMQPRAR